MTFPIALSPCPNDTFLFHAWIHGIVGQDFLPKPTYADIEQLNQWALEKKYPLIKVSVACYAKIQKDYRLLPVGAALGKNCGPKIVSRTPFPLARISHQHSSRFGQTVLPDDKERLEGRVKLTLPRGYLKSDGEADGQSGRTVGEKCGLEEIANKTVAIPGKETTAHLLFNHFAPPPKKKLFCRYHEIEQLLHSRAADCGIIIHESRFTFQKHGFHEIIDLGMLWENRYKLPLPLGCLALLRSCPTPIFDSITQILRASLCYAKTHPKESENFISSLSQEKDPAVIQKHISLYVNEQTEQLSSTGKEAIIKLLNCGEKTNVCL